MNVVSYSKNLIENVRNIVRSVKDFFFLCYPVWDKDFESNLTCLYRHAICRKLCKTKWQRPLIAFAMYMKRTNNVETVVSSFRKVAAIYPRQAVSVLCPFSGLRSQLHNSEDAFTSTDMFASWVGVRSKRNGPLSWMRVPGVGGGNGIGKVGSRRFLQGTPSCQLITNSGHRATRLVN